MSTSGANANAGSAHALSPIDALVSVATNGVAELRSKSVDAASEGAPSPSFEGIFFAGFECSDHLLPCGRRLDLLKSTRHEEFVAEDYARARAIGMSTCRDGISWVRCEPRAGRFDFSSFLPRLRAAEGNVRVIWDLMHFGFPEHVDIFARNFPARFGRYAREVARFIADESAAAPYFTVINEMSFLAWAGGDVGCINPYAVARASELKVQLVLATIEAIEAIRSVLPSARFLHAEPAIHVVRDEANPKTWRAAECDDLLQFEALDMLSGRTWHRLGGHPKYLDIVGVNFYPNNQFMLDGTTIERGDPRYRPFASLLLDIWSRYRRPMILSETGSEGEERAPWLRYVSEQCALAMERDCELHGITLYPVVDHPGWVDDRHCPNGLWGYADERGERPVCEPLLEEIQRQTPVLLAARAAMLDRARTASATACADVIAAEL